MRTQAVGFMLATFMLMGCPKVAEPENAAAPAPDAREEVLDALQDLDADLDELPEEREDASPANGEDASPFSAPSTKRDDVYAPVHGDVYEDIVGC